MLRGLLGHTPFYRWKENTLIKALFFPKKRQLLAPREAAPISSHSCVALKFRIFLFYRILTLMSNSTNSISPYWHNLYFTNQVFKSLRIDVECTPIFTAALFIRARTWKKPRCPSTDKWTKKLWYIYTMEYYSAIKRNAFESVLMRWMNLEPIIQSEVSQKEKNVISMHIYGI